MDYKNNNNRKLLLDAMDDELLKQIKDETAMNYKLAGVNPNAMKQEKEDFNEEEFHKNLIDKENAFVKMLKEKANENYQMAGGKPTEDDDSFYRNMSDDDRRQIINEKQAALIKMIQDETARNNEEITRRNAPEQQIPMISDTQLARAQPRFKRTNKLINN